MQFTVTAAAFMALISSAIAQVDGFDAITAPTKGQEVTADGKTATTITWDPSSEYDGQTVSILLLQGASEGSLDFYDGDDVASSIDSKLGSYEWTPDSSIAGFTTYGLKLQLDSDPTIFQYSFPFKVAAGSDDSSSSSSSKTDTTTTSSADDATTTSASTNNNVAASSSEDTVASTSTTTSAAPTSTSSTTGSGSSNSSDADSSAATTAAQTTLTTATGATATGSSAASSTTAPVTAGAARVAAGGLAAAGGVMAMLLL